MISKGARHIVLLSRSGSSSGKVHELIEEANAAGATIVVRACDIANRTQVDAVLNSLSDLPPVRGLIHGAMVLKVSSTWHYFNSSGLPSEGHAFRKYGLFRLA